MVINTVAKNVPQPKRVIECIVPIIVIVIDQATKAIIRALVPPYDNVSVIPGFFNIKHVLNSGIAFGMLEDASFLYRTFVTVVFTSLGLFCIEMYLLAKIAHDKLISRIGLALMIGGGISNLIDRVLMGSVVDFFDIYFGTYHFWTFNVADATAFVGFMMFTVDFLNRELRTTT